MISRLDNLSCHYGNYRRLEAQRKWDVTLRKRREIRGIKPEKRLADAELGNTKFMPVDKAVLMADRYNAPWLLNHYCLNECPIGCRHSLSDEVVGIDRVTVKLLKSLKTEQLGEVKDTLLDIAADGKITADEKPALQEVLTYLDDLAKTVSELKTIGEMALNEDGDAHGSK